jgi:phage baseplate assembly protein W
MPYKNIEINGPVSVAQQVQQVNQFYVGFSSVDPTNVGSKLYDFDLVKQDIINQFNTKRGERVMNPNFGSVIWDLIMEPLTPATKEILTADITAICNSDPRVTPTQIDLTEYPSGYILELTLMMNKTNQSSNLRLAFDSKLGLIAQ